MPKGPSMPKGRSMPILSQLAVVQKIRHPVFRYGKNGGNKTSQQKAAMKD